MLSQALSGPYVVQSACDNLDDVTGLRYRVLDDDTSGSSNWQMPVDPGPQSISIVNNDFVKAAVPENVSDVTQYTTGAMWDRSNPRNANELWILGRASW